MINKQGFLIELEREKENTLKILNNLNEDKFSWKPHAKSMSLGELVNHIVELHDWVALSLTKDIFDFHTDYIPLDENSVESLKAKIESGYINNVNAVKSLEDSDFLKTWTFKAGDHIIASLPKAAALRFIVQNHLIHHRGQLTVYMRMLDMPVPGIYGPSADDK